MRAPPAVRVALTVLVAVALALPALGLRTDNGIRVWLPADDPELVAYERFQKTFGSDDFVVAGAVDADPATAAGALAALRDTLASEPGVARIVGATPGPDGSLVPRDPFEAALTARDDAGRVSVAAVVFLEAGLDSAAHAATVDRIEDVARDLPGEAWAVAGPAMLNRALDTTSRSSFAALLPATGIGLLLVLAIGLRSARAALVVAGAAALACASALGIVALAGRPLHMVLSVLPALLLVLGTAYALHPLARFLDDPMRPGEIVEERWRRAVRDTFRPGLVAAGTTAAGLGSLALAELPPVRDLGIFGGIGVLIAFVLAYVLVPPALMLLRLRPQPGRSGGLTGSVAPWIAGFCARRPGAIVAVSLVAVLAGAAGIASLRVESNVLRLLGEDTAVPRATALLETRLMGLTPIEVALEGPTESVLSAETVRAARAFGAACLTEELVTHVLGPFGTDEAGAEATRLGAAARADALPGYVHLDGDRASLRLTLATRTVSSDASHALAERVRARIREQITGGVAPGFPDGVSVGVTGAVPLLVEMQGALVDSQLRSFGGAFLLVSVMLLLHLRSPVLAGAALVPNLLPAVMAAGAMGWLGLPLDAATVAVAGIALGLAVDDTVHVLHRWHATGGDLSRTLRGTTRPIVLSTAAAVAGFAGFAVSPFPPAARLGLLVAGSAVVALLADLFLLPAVLPHLRRRAPESRLEEALARTIT